MEYTKEYLQRLQAHLEKTNQVWCFDEFGKVWTRETISIAILTAPELRIMAK
jgi:hypothetical protein